MRRGADGIVSTVTPEGRQWNVRTTSGSPYTVKAGVVYFSNSVDGALYTQFAAFPVDPVPLTPAGERAPSEEYPVAILIPQKKPLVMTFFLKAFGHDFLFVPHPFSTCPIESMYADGTNPLLDTKAALASRIRTSIPLGSVSCVYALSPQAGRRSSPSRSRTRGMTRRCHRRLLSAHPSTGWRHQPSHLTSASSHGWTWQASRTRRSMLGSCLMPEMLPRRGAWRLELHTQHGQIWARSTLPPSSMAGQ